MKHEDLFYFLHMMDAIRLIELYTTGKDEIQFFDDHFLQDGVIRQLEILGEAVKHLSQSLRKQYPSIPWLDIAGTRDKLIHDYFGVDVEKVWVMVQDDLPYLKDNLQIILDHVKLDKKD